MWCGLYGLSTWYDPDWLQCGLVACRRPCKDGWVLIHVPALQHQALCTKYDTKYGLNGVCTLCIVIKVLECVC